MTGKKILFVLFCIILTASFTATAQNLNSYQEEERKYLAANKILERFYSHFESVEENQKAKDAFGELIRQYSDDPYLYDLWTTAEWVQISHELDMKVDEGGIALNKKASFGNRVTEYYKMTDQGLALTNNITSSKFLFARAALFCNRATFTGKFRDGLDLNKLEQADQEAAEGIKALKQILVEMADFCPAFFLLGISRYQLATARGSWWMPDALVRLAISKKSKSYKELSELDQDVFNADRAIVWMEKMFNCGYQELWYKKAWLESGLILKKAYERQLGICRENTDTRKELTVLEKLLPMLEKLYRSLPENNELSQKLVSEKVRLTILQRYFNK